MKASLIVTGATMPAGDYFVGDPCYAVPDDRWSEWLAAADPDVFGPDATSHNVKRVLLAELDGYPVLGIGTAFGDGEYADQNGRRYGVDAGMIGLVPVALADSDELERLDARHLGYVVTFDSDFECRYEDGSIILGHVSIDTEGSDEHDEQWDIEEEDTNGEV